MVDAWSNARLVDASATAPLGVAVVGYGYWGPNLARNVASAPSSSCVALCERDATARGRLPPSAIPACPSSADLDAVLANDARRGGARRHAAATHYPIVKQALEAGKHVLVEKPLATTSADAPRARGAGGGRRASC